MSRSAKYKAAANWKRELVQHAIRDEHKRSGRPSESYQSDFRVEVVEMWGSSAHGENRD
jgi:hypothetical protein